MIPPIRTREQKLPFEQLTWQKFEQLCLRLVRLDQSVEHTQPYGVQGDEQGGIDIYARHRDTSLYSVFQCKNEGDFGPSKIKEAVDVFLEGEWAKTSSAFVLCSRESLAPKVRADAVEAQAKRLRKRGITFVPWDEGMLCALLKEHPEIVDDFFGRPWVEAFCGPQAAQELGTRLTAEQKEAVLTAYYSWLSEKVGHVVYRGYANRSSAERTVELPLENVYVAPYLVSEDERDVQRRREREIIHQLQDPDLDETQQAALEIEFRALKMGDWLYSTVSWDDGWELKRHPQTSSSTKPLTLPEALLNEKRGVVLGAPGAGKSTLLRWLALMCVRARLHPSETNLLTPLTDDAQLLPLLIPLAAFANTLQSGNATTLHDFVRSHLQTLGIENIERLYRSEFSAGTCWILLDGIDEIAGAEVRADVVRAIETFLAGLGSNRCLLTSRLHGYERIAGVPHFHLQSLYTDQVSEFIFKWNLYLELGLNADANAVERGSQNSQSLFDQLNANETLKSLATNPLLLVSLLLMHRQNQTLPQSRVEIYHAMTQTLLETWNFWRSEARYDAGGQILTSVQLRTVLGKVALWSRREKPRGILRRQELKRQFITALQELQIQTNDLESIAQSYLNAAVEQAGLLEERTPGIFAFWHPTFEEFLAAHELANSPNETATKLLPLRFDPFWREVVLLTVGLVEVINDDRDLASDLVRTLVKTDPPIFEPILHSSLRLGIDCIIERPALNRNLVQELLCELVVSLTHQPYEPLGGSFLEVAGVLPNFKPNPSLIEALGELVKLDHSLGDVRTNAYRLLANAASSNQRAEQICLLKYEDGLDKTDIWKDVMARFYATIGCVRAGHYTPFMLVNITGTTQGISHIQRAVELLDLDEHVPTTDLEQRRKNLGLVRSVLNQTIESPSPTSPGPLSEEEAGVIMEPLSAALLMLFAGDRSPRVIEVFEEALKPKYDNLGVIFDAAHAPLMFDFGEEDTIRLQRLALVALRRWFRHPTPERRLHAANETLRFIESWEEMYGPYIEQATEFEGRVEEAKREKFIEAYRIDRQILRREALTSLKTCLHVSNLQTRLLAGEFLLRCGQIETVARAIEKWMKVNADMWADTSIGKLISQLSEFSAGAAVIIGWLHSTNASLRFISATAMLPFTHHRQAALEALKMCLESSLDEVRCSAGAVLTFFTSHVEGLPLNPEIEAALRSCLESDVRDVRRNAASILYQAGLREEQLLPHLFTYMTTQEVGQRFATLRAFQEYNAEMEILEPIIERQGLQGSATQTVLEKVKIGQTLTGEDIEILKSLIQRQADDNHEIYFYRRCFYDWIWFNLEVKN